MHTDSTYLMPRTDSVFVFGTVGRGDALLFINGQSVPVYPTGGWIAWLPLEVRAADTVATFDLVAWAEGATHRAQFRAALTPAFDPRGAPLWIDTTAFAPSGDWWVRPDEGVLLSMRATPGARVRGIIGDSVVEFVPDTAPTPPSWGELAFGTERPSRTAPRSDRYLAWWVGALGPDPGTMFAPTTAQDTTSGWMIVEAIQGGDTVRARWPLRMRAVDPRRLPVVVVDDDPTGVGNTDSTLAGRASPFGTYHWFFPTSTLARASGRRNSQVRLRLSATSAAWVDAGDVHPLPATTPPPVGTARSMRLIPTEHAAVLRIPLPARVPFRVDERERTVEITLYGVAIDMDWIQYGGTDPFVRLIEFSQRTEDEAVITVHLSHPVWGYRTQWQERNLLVEFRRPPRIERRNVLAGMRIVLDPGHPPGGARGPTGVPEHEVVLAVAKRAAQLFAARGAAVTLTRETSASIGLVERIRLAERADADLLISIHANALPDGMNPFINSGTSVYYFHPRSAPLARAVNRALVRQLGFRDLGMGRGDLALARPTWMPSVLTEGLFIMVPDQEAVLTSADGQERYATGLLEGVVSFLETWRAQANRPPVPAP